MTNYSIIHISVAALTMTLCCSCNHNDEVVREDVLLVQDEYPLIINGNYKTNPIISPTMYADRYAVIHSPVELEILPANFIDGYLTEVDFNRNFILACRLLSDSDIVGYTALARLNPETKELSVIVTYECDAWETATAMEYVAVMLLPTVEYSSITYAHTTTTLSR